MDFPKGVPIPDDPDSNWPLPFNKMCKKYGREFIEHLQASYVANVGVISDERWRQLNGDVPESFFQSKIKNNNPYL